MTNFCPTSNRHKVVVDQNLVIGNSCKIKRGADLSGSISRQLGLKWLT